MKKTRSKKAKTAKVARAPKPKAAKRKRRARFDIESLSKPSRTPVMIEQPVQLVRMPGSIIVGKRHRKVYGDIDAFAHEIDEVGLLQPIVITPDHRLIAGERRLKAWARSKYANDPIPVREIDLKAIARGEWSENAFRLDFTPSEAVAIKRELEPLLKDAAKERQRQHGGTAPGKKQSGQVAHSVTVPAAAAAPKGRASDQAAGFTGMKRRTLEKAEKVVAAAEQDPERFGKLKQDMDRTGRVDGPFRRLEIMRQADEIRQSPPPLPMQGPYSVAVLDFPWPHEPDMDQDEIEARGRSLRPYPPMSIKAGCHFMRDKVAPILAKDCTVYFWTTNFHMPYAFHLLAALGFNQHSTIGTWVKNRQGRGQVLRDKTEHCIVAKRGRPVIHLTTQTTDWSGEGWETRDNSQKPEAFYRLVEAVTPAARYASFFSRGGEGPNWDCHGDQVGKYADAARASPALPANDDPEFLEWKALGAIAAGMGVSGPVVEQLVARNLIARPSFPDVGGNGPEWKLTRDGADRLDALDDQFSPRAQPPADVSRRAADERAPAFADAEGVALYAIEAGEQAVPDDDIVDRLGAAGLVCWIGEDLRLTEKGVARVAEIRAEEAAWRAHGDPAPDQTALAKQRTLFDRLYMVMVGDGLLLMDDERAELQCEKLVKGKGAMQLTVAGKRRFDELQEERYQQQRLAVLAAIEAGEDIPNGCAGNLPRLAQDKLIVGIKKPRLTKLGKATLANLREEDARARTLAELPDDIEQLIVEYGATLQRHHVAVMAADPGTVEREADRLELLEEKANGATRFGCASHDSPAERLRRETAALIGEVPMWGQRGMFRLEIDGTPYLVKVNEWFDCGVYAAHPDKGFISETGFRSCSVNGDPALGVTVDAQAEAYIREDIASTHDYRSGKVKARKGPLPLPEKVHRLPASWDEAAAPVEIGKKVAKALIQVDASHRVASAYVTPEEVIELAVKAGHVVSMTIDWADAGDDLKGGTSVGTCQCGAVFRASRKLPRAGHDVLDAEIAAHRREVLGLPPAENSPTTGDGAANGEQSSQGDGAGAADRALDPPPAENEIPPAADPGKMPTFLERGHPDCTFGSAE